VAEVMETALLPVELRVRDCEVDVLTATLPNAMLVALIVSAGIAAFNCSVKFAETVPACAVRIADCPVDTAAIAAEKLAVAAPAGTVMVAGTVTAELLLERPTANPPLAAAALSETVQASVDNPVMEAFVQESADNTGTPVPLRPITEDAPPEPSLAMVN
jgi:hypothetical protein